MQNANWSCEYKKVVSAFLSLCKETILLSIFFVFYCFLFLNVSFLLDNVITLITVLYYSLKSAFIPAFIQ